MRQAGRYLPEYREIRSKHKMLEVIRTPELAARVTLQPIERFDLDAAIIFADILNPLIGMGVELDFVEGDGPKIFNPVKSAADVDRLRVPPPEENVGYTLEAIGIVSKELAPRNIPLIGFSGAPFTLSAYLVDGKTNNSLDGLKRFIFSETQAFHALQEKLSDLIISYFEAQVRAGAKALQLFDSWLGALGPAEFEEFAFPYVNKIILETKKRCDVPFIYFAPNTAGIYPQLKKLQADVMGIDWRIGLSDAARRLDNKFVLQGNLDPSLMAGSLDRALAETDRIMFERVSLKGHIFNLGHGIVPHTPPDNLARVIDRVRQGPSGA